MIYAFSKAFEICRFFQKVKFSGIQFFPFSAGSLQLLIENSSAMMSQFRYPHIYHYRAHINFSPWLLAGFNLVAKFPGAWQTLSAWSSHLSASSYLYVLECSIKGFYNWLSHTINLHWKHITPREDHLNATLCLLIL